MDTRRNFFKKSVAAASALSLPTIGAFGAKSTTGLGPRRFVFIRKANGFWPNAWVPPTFTEQQVRINKNREALEVDFDKHELPPQLAPIADLKSNVCVLHGLSSRMSKNGHSSGVARLKSNKIDV